MSGCSADPPGGQPRPSGPRAIEPTAAPNAGALKLTAAQKSSIGWKIWQNESAGKITGLTHWNDGEEFPSLGIGHFIWYPRGFNGRWSETWPEFVNYAIQRGLQVPTVGRNRNCPWPNKPSFVRDFNGPQLAGLRKWLAANMTIQTEFIAYKSQAALPRIMHAAPTQERARIKANYDKVASNANGVYALVDYVNFKGDGTNPTERYNNQGWGLMWVLMEMKDVPAGQTAAREFCAAAINGPLKHAAKVIQRSNDQLARLKSIKEAYQQNGLARVKSLIALVKSTPQGADPSLNADHLEEIAKLDPDDSLGFRKNHLAEMGFAILDRGLKEVFHKDSYDEVIQLVDDYITRFEPKGALL
ncbi:hypothetical protein N9074_03815, partial [Akkermansiaceae bacterium]|nr:hypothetical protein [Akkermansiaceae bacterium]